MTSTLGTNRWATKRSSLLVVAFSVCASACSGTTDTTSAPGSNVAVSPASVVVSSPPSVGSSAPSATTTVPPAASTSSPPSATKPTRATAVPKVGECRGPATADIAYANTDSRPAIGCAAPHGFETVHVDRMPGTITSYPTDPSTGTVTPALLGFVNETCNPIVAAYAGTARSGTRILATRLSMFWFLPTPAEFDDGARWIRCDAAITPIDDEVVTIPQTLRGRLSSVQLPIGGFGQTAAKGSIPNELVICSPSTDDEFVVYVPCQEPHLWESALMDQRVFASQEKFDARALEAAAATLCDGDVLGTDALLPGTDRRADAINLAPAWRIPSADSWEFGDRMVWCIIKSVDGRPYIGSWLGTDSTISGP
jgi:hypothetical protein